MKRITVLDAAEQLNLSPLTIRVLMQQEKLPIGYCQKQEGKERAYYIIYQELVDGFKRRTEKGNL